MEALIERYAVSRRLTEPSTAPLELTEAVGIAPGATDRPLPIPDSVLKEILQNHLDRAADDIMLGFEATIERMNQGLREALEEHLKLTRRQMRENLREVLQHITRSSNSPE
jgi:hypothetical protein